MKVRLPMVDIEKGVVFAEESSGWWWCLYIMRKSSKILLSIASATYA